VSRRAGHSDLETTLKYLHVNENYEYLEMDKMLANEKANEEEDCVFGRVPKGQLFNPNPDLEPR
jgi:hypothetical protein